MDPDEALRQAREATDTIQRILADDPSVSPEVLQDAAEDLANAFGALDAWLSTGGFMPLAWQNHGGLKGS